MQVLQKVMWQIQAKISWATERQREKFYVSSLKDECYRQRMVELGVCFSQSSGNGKGTTAMTLMIRNKNWSTKVHWNNIDNTSVCCRKVLYWEAQNASDGFIILVRFKFLQDFSFWDLMQLWGSLCCLVMKKELQILQRTSAGHGF